MPIPLAVPIGAMAAGTLISGISNILGANKAAKAAKRAHEEQMRQARMAAVSRALQGKYSSGAAPTGVSEPPKPPDLTGSAIGAGLGNILATVGSFLLPQIKAGGTPAAPTLPKPQVYL